MDPIAWIRLLSASATALAGLLLAFVLVYGRLSALSLRRLASAPPRSLTAPELAALRAWQRRTLAWFLFTMGSLVSYASSWVLVRWLSPWVYLIGFVAVLGIAAAGLLVHFAHRCPSCGRRIGFQAALVLPPGCEICGTAFQQGAPPVFPAATTRARIESRTRILGWPLVAVALGPDPATGRYGVARGVIAVGDVAIGGVAVGGVAVGVLAVGGVAIGALAVGGLALGLAALGGFAAGGFALGGVALGAYALGGIAMGLHALGGLAVPGGPVR
jgi:hypothetical protein